MQACRYLGVAFHQVERVPWPVARQWAAAAQGAEAEAQQVLAERAAKASRR